MSLGTPHQAVPRVEGRGEGDREDDRLGVDGWMRKMSIPDVGGGRYGELGTVFIITSSEVAGRGSYDGCCKV